MPRVELHHLLELIEKYGEDVSDIFFIPDRLYIDYVATIPNLSLDGKIEPVEWVLSEYFTETYGDAGQDEYYEAWAKFFNYCQEAEDHFWAMYNADPDE